MREAAKQLHEHARSSGTGSVSCILRASVARSGASRSFIGDFQRGTGDSSDESPHAQSSLSGHMFKGTDAITAAAPDTNALYPDASQSSEEADVMTHESQGHNLPRVNGADRCVGAVDVGGPLGESEEARRARQWCLLLKRLAYVALAVSVVVSGVVLATDGDVLAMAAEKMDRGTAKGQLRRNTEMRAATFSERRPGLLGRR